MHKIVALFVAALIAVTLTGCGGSSPSTTSGSSTTTAAAPVAATPAPGVTATSTGGDVSQPATGYPAPFPEVSTASAPPAIVSDLAAGQPMVLLFEDSSDFTTNDVRGAVDAVIKKYRGLITLHVVDVAKLPKSIDTKTPKGQAAVQALALANRLQVGYMPYIVIVNGDKTQTFRSSGVIDKSLLEREVLRATQ